jgi:hypothetical protein
MRLPLELHDELFTAIADAVAQWEPEARDGWDADVTALPEDDSLEAGYDRLARTLEIKHRFQDILLDGIGADEGEHLDQFAERLVRDMALLRWLHAEAAFERDRFRAVVDALREAHHIPYEDEEHQGGSCADIVVTLIARALKAEQELERLHSWQGLMSLLDEHWPRTVFKGATEDPGPTIVFLVREVDRLRELNAALIELNSAEHDNYAASTAELEAELDRERSSRQAWAVEAMRLDMISRERKRLLADALNQPRRQAWGELLDEAGRLAERWVDELAAEALREPEVDGGRRVCACISDDQAAQLGPRFSRPVCAVHATEDERLLAVAEARAAVDTGARTPLEVAARPFSAELEPTDNHPVSTLTGEPCTHQYGQPLPVRKRKSARPACRCKSHDPKYHEGTCGHCGQDWDMDCLAGCPVGEIVAARNLAEYGPEPQPFLTINISPVEGGDTSP